MKRAWRLLRPAAAGLAMTFMISPLSAEPTRTLSLSDCYRMALKQSEEVAMRAELITETEGRFQQAMSGILPRLSFSSTDKRQDGNGGSAFTLRHLPERKFVFSQPLFAGFKEFAAMRGVKAQKRKREQEKARAEQLLLVDISDAFHLLLEERQDLLVLDSVRQVLRERIRELEDRERIGRSRSSEVVTARAQLYRVEAEWESAQSRVTISEQLLEFLTGLDAIGDLADPGPVLPPAAPETDYLTKAAARPDVKAAEEAAEFARQQKGVARAQYLPTVGVDGNYYLERAGVSKDVTWDAALKVDVPIFQGGQAAGANREAASVARQAELRLKQLRRTAQREVRDAYADYDSARLRLNALLKALDATEESYQLQAQEYRLSLVSNLEVLNTLQILQDSRREVIHAQQEARRLYWKLKASAGCPAGSAGCSAPPDC